jgi:hypothetical protein
MSYGPNMSQKYERAAEYVDRIFKGAKPADLPIEQPTRNAIRREWSCGCKGSSA